MARLEMTMRIIAKNEIEAKGAYKAIADALPYAFDGGMGLMGKDGSVDITCEGLMVNADCVDVRTKIKEALKEFEALDTTFVYLMMVNIEDGVHSLSKIDKNGTTPLNGGDIASGWSSNIALHFDDLGNVDTKAITEVINECLDMLLLKEELECSGIVLPNVRQDKVVLMLERLASIDTENSLVVNVHFGSIRDTPESVMYRLDNGNVAKVTNECEDEIKAYKLTSKRLEEIIKEEILYTERSYLLDMVKQYIEDNIVYDGDINITNDSLKVVNLKQTISDSLKAMETELSSEIGSRLRKQGLSQLTFIWNEEKNEYILIVRGSDCDNKIANIVEQELSISEIEEKLLDSIIDSMFNEMGVGAINEWVSNTILDNEVPITYEVSYKGAKGIFASNDYQALVDWLLEADMK